MAEYDRVCGKLSDLEDHEARVDEILRNQGHDPKATRAAANGSTDPDCEKRLKSARIQASTEDSGHRAQGEAARNRGHLHL